MLQLNVNTDKVVQFTNRLEQFRKNAFPTAVRNALNGAAFDVKTNTMLATAKDAFEERDKNFFRATSKVIKAAGNDVNTMQSEVGFTANSLHSGNNQAVEDLEKQEDGGNIGGRSFIPLNSARVGGSKTGKVRTAFRLRVLKIVDSRKANGKSPGQKFIKSAFFAGVGGIVLGEFRGELILWRINSLNRNDKGGLKLTALYSFVQGRTVDIKRKTNFMEKASLKSANTIEDIYIKEANRIFERWD